MSLPLDPIAAVTHPDPYPYYAGLVARRPLYRDEKLGLWVASGAAAATSVLNSDLCRVRPSAEPVPRALLGSPAADIFRRLVRMNDGKDHARVKRAVSAALDAIGPDEAAAEAARQAQKLDGGIGPGTDPGRLTDFAFRLPVHAVASLLGAPADELPRIAAYMDDFVRCLAPASTPDQIERGKYAAGKLLELFGSLRPAAGGGLFAGLARETERIGAEPDDASVVAANGIGFMSQAYEATAGLIGNTLIALARRPDLCGKAASVPGLLRDVVREVVRHDPPIQNTRRFLARSGRVAGQEMEEGDAILVVLAAANRDPAVNPEPDRFDHSRADRRVFTFGTGPHACPGEALAVAIATAGVAQLLRSGIDMGQFGKAAAVTYRASANARIPMFGA